MNNMNLSQMCSVLDSDIAGTEAMKKAMQNMVDNAIEQEDIRKRKSEEYKSLVGRRFKPSFQSEIKFFEIRGYDAERDMVLTKAYPKDGEPFDDEIEERYLVGAFETGEYVAIKYKPAESNFVITNPYQYLNGYVPKEMNQVFNGQCCNRCKHRFGTTSNKEWCKSHYKNEKCYRFKLDM